MVSNSNPHQNLLNSNGIEEISQFGRGKKVPYIPNVLKACICIVVLVLVTSILTGDNVSQNYPFRNIYARIEFPIFENTDYVDDDIFDAYDDSYETIVENETVQEYIYSDKELEDIFSKRREIQKHGCKYLSMISDAMKDRTVSLKGLLRLHDDIYNLRSPRKNQTLCRTSTTNISSVKMVSKPYKIAICLPPKCGTTNWQKALAVIEMKARGKPGMVPDDFVVPSVFRLLPKFVMKKHLPYVAARSTNIANSRNPFGRLFSAWNDKSRTHTYNNGSLMKPAKYSKWFNHQLDINFHAKYYPGQKVFQKLKPPSGRNVSWETFVEYVAANPGDKVMNHHWRAQFHQCHLCLLRYDYITHLENSHQEADYLLRKMEIDKLTYIPGKYVWTPEGDTAQKQWATIPRQTMTEIYKHYFADFVLLGYSTADVMKYMKYSDETLPTSSEYLKQRSRLRLDPLARIYLKSNTDFYC